MKAKMKTLDGIGNRVPYITPDNYFDDFAKKMDEMAHAESKSFSLRSISRPWIYLAAMFVGMLVVTNILINLNGKENAEAITYEQYLSSQIDPTVLADYYLSED